jgi:hypothetical protein
METSEAVLLRTFVVAAMTFPIALLLHWSCRGLVAGTRMMLVFVLLMYCATYFAGVAALFVGQELVIETYFGGAMAPPAGTPFTALFLLAALPIAVVPAVVGLAAARRSAQHPVMATAPEQRSAWPPGVAALLVLVASLLHLGELVPELLGNAFGGLQQPEGLIELYARRLALFETLSATQAGLIYGTIPAAAALLLFTDGPGRLSLQACGVVALVLAALLNVGLFQIGPLLAFGLMLLMCLLVRVHARRVVPTAVGAALLGLAAFAAYQGLKGDEGGTPLLQILLRMPISLPYLWQLAVDAPTELMASQSLAHDLGEFMFPELRLVERFVAMPQPAFVEAYFRFGLLGAIAVLALVGALVVIFGWLFDRLRSARHRVQVVIIAVPALYYAFQVNLPDLVLSSYGVVFTAAPVLAAAFAERMLRPTRRAHIVLS